MHLHTSTCVQLHVLGFAFGVEGTGVVSNMFYLELGSDCNFFVILIMHVLGTNPMTTTSKN